MRNILYPCWLSIKKCILSLFDHRVDSLYSLIVVGNGKIYQTSNNDFRYHMEERFVYFPLDSCDLKGQLTFRVTKISNVRDTIDRVVINFDTLTPNEMLYKNYRFNEYKKMSYKNGIFQIRIPNSSICPPYVLYSFKD